jgi:hypothetical protein
MSDSAYYRAEARRMLGWATTSPNQGMAQRWRRLADDYEALADQLDSNGAVMSPVQAVPSQAGPTQRQVKGRPGCTGPEHAAED